MSPTFGWEEAHSFRNEITAGVLTSSADGASSVRARTSAQLCRLPL